MYKPEILELLTAAARVRALALDPLTVETVLGATPDAQDVAILQFDVRDAIRQVAEEIHTGNIAPAPRLVRGRPLAEWLDGHAGRTVPLRSMIDTLSRRLEPLLRARVESLVLAVERRDESAWRLLCESLVALDALARVASPERRGAMLTVAEMSARLGILPKSTRRMIAEGRLRPAVREGRFIRFKGDERPGIRRSGSEVARVVATPGVRQPRIRTGTGPSGAVTGGRSRD